jgi:cytochrome c oxidase assembly factor CtaG
MLSGAELTAAVPPLPAPLTGSAVATAWHVNVPVVATLLMVAGLYLAGTVRFRRLRGERWPVHRTVLFCGLGLGGFAFTTMSFLGVYQQVLFWARAVQIITLLMVVPLFLALGAPLGLAIEAGPRWLSGGIRAVLASRAAQLATFPAVVSGIFLATPFVAYFSPLYEATLRSRGAAWALSFGLVAIGYLYYWTRLRLEPVPKEYPHLVSVWITFAEAIADGALGLTLMLGHHLVAGDYYTALGRTWGPTPKQDQVWGGGALWLIGDLAGVPFIGALWRRMFQEDRVRAAEVDAELDALEAREAEVRAAAAVAAGAGAGLAADGPSGGAGDVDVTTHSGTAMPGPNGVTIPASAGGTASESATVGVGGRSAEEEAQRSRPWWETDPVLGVRYGFIDPE